MTLTHSDIYSNLFFPSNAGLSQFSWSCETHFWSPSLLVTLIFSVSDSWFAQALQTLLPSACVVLLSLPSILQTCNMPMTLGHSWKVRSAVLVQCANTNSCLAHCACRGACTGHSLVYLTWTPILPGMIRSALCLVSHQGFCSVWHYFLRANF